MCCSGCTVIIIHIRISAAEPGSDAGHPDAAAQAGQQGQPAPPSQERGQRRQTQQGQVQQKELDYSVHPFCP